MPLESTSGRNCTHPDEGVWQHLKHYELRNLCCVYLDHLEVHFWFQQNELGRANSSLLSVLPGLVIARGL